MEKRDNTETAHHWQFQNCGWQQPAGSRERHRQKMEEENGMEIRRGDAKMMRRSSCSTWFFVADFPFIFLLGLWCDGLLSCDFRGVTFGNPCYCKKFCDYESCKQPTITNENWKLDSEEDMCQPVILPTAQRCTCMVLQKVWYDDMKWNRRDWCSSFKSSMHVPKFEVDGNLWTLL